jgi:hypothetical protein
MPTGPMPKIAVRTTGPATGAIQRLDPARPQISRAPSVAPPSVADASASVADTPAAVADAKSNTLAKISLALAVLFGAVLSPITLIMGLIARSQIKRTGQGGADIALAAMVVSAVFLGIGVLSVALLRYGAM